MKKKYLMEYNMVFANTFGVLLLIICIGTFAMLACLGLVSADPKDYNILSFLGCILYLWVHEMVHGISYQLMGAKRENIKYGIALDKGILFCKCGQEVDRKNILVSIMAPFVVLGIITLIIGIIFGLNHLILFSLFNISGCSGDLMMFFWFLTRKDKGFTFREIGDSTKFVLNTKEKLNEKKFLTCKVKEVLDKDIKDDKYLNKFNINKFSIITIIVFTLIMIFDYIAIYVIG